MEDQCGTGALTKTSAKVSSTKTMFNFEWIPHPLASGKPKTVRVEDLDSAWKDPSLRIEKEGGNGIGDRYKNAQEFLKENKTVWMPEVSVNRFGDVTFIDGRHRFAALRDMGVKEIKVMMQGANNWKKQ